jgi:hypothetical protein
MTEILKPGVGAVEDQEARFWSDPEAIQDAGIDAMEDLLGRDVDYLAAATGVSRRQLNKQRERRFDLLRTQLLPRLATIFHAAATKFGAARTARALHLLTRAGGHELASAVPPAASAGSKESALALISRAMREVCDAASKFSARAEDGLDHQDAFALLPEVDEGLQELQSVRNLLLRRIEEHEHTGPRRTQA